MSVAPQYNCSGGNSTSPDVCYLSFVADPTVKECDDDNIVDGDGCS